MSGMVSGNMLGDSTSPYLLQHKDNPVHWRPWGEGAFCEAAARNVPVFLSIGYSTCHWCHVMAHESFEDAGIARTLNESFVAVKVDREERPDVDAEYMLFVQATNNGAGGWPLSVFLTPARVPFFGATYIDPQRFSALLAAISSEPQIEASGGRILEVLQGVIARDARDGGDNENAFQAASADALRSIDSRHGGFGDDSAKFPNAPLLAMLVSASQSVGRALPDPLCVTLRAMARGALWDHVGCGFHRYTVDRAWNVPHFEKMLYDQALLLGVYARALDASRTQAVGDSGSVTNADSGDSKIFCKVVFGIAEYMLGVLRGPDGCFYCAEDADSIPPSPAEQPSLAHPTASKDATNASARGKTREGAFYVWGEEELRNMLPDSYDAFAKSYRVAPGGNVPSALDTHGELSGVNTLRLAADCPFTIPTLRSIADHPPACDSGNSLLDRLRERREATRERPHLDQKVVVSWNALAISGLCAAFYATGESTLIDAALAAMSGVETAFLQKTDTGALVIRSRCMLRGRLSEALAVADDYAALIAASLDLWNASLSPAHLDRAIALQKTLDTCYWNEDGGAYSIRSKNVSRSENGNETGIVSKSIFDLLPVKDGAEPCCNGIALQNMLRLSAIDSGIAKGLSDKCHKLAARAGPDVSMATILTAVFEYGDESRVAKITLPDKLAGDFCAIRAAVRRALVDLIGVPRVLACHDAPAQLCINRTCRPIDI